MFFDESLYFLLTIGISILAIAILILNNVIKIYSKSTIPKLEIEISEDNIPEIWRNKIYDEKTNKLSDDLLDIIRKESLENQEPVFDVSCSERQFCGTWKSKIYEDESGIFTVDILDVKVNKNIKKQEAKIILFYSEKSKYKKNGKITIDCECTEDLHMLYLRQKEFTTKQYFTLSIAKNKSKFSYLTSLDPHDFVQLKLD